MVPVLAWLAWACSGDDGASDGSTDVVVVGTDADLLLTDLVRLEVEVSSGLAALGGFDTDTVEVRTGGGEPGDSWDHSEEEGVASLWTLCSTGERGCGVGFDLVVPNGLPIIVSSFEGPVDLVGHEGSMQITTNSGPVTVQERPTSPLSIVTRSGPVDVTYREDPTLLEVSTGSGSITVTLPGQDYEIQATSQTGDVTFEGVRNVGGAPQVRLSSEGGDIRIVGTGA